MSCLVFCAGMDLPLPFELFMGWQATCRDVGGTCGFFRTMHGGVSAPSCCAFIHRVSFEEVFGHQFLFKSGPEIEVSRHVSPPMRLRLEFPHETGLIPRCTGKVGNPFQPKQQNPPCCRDHEGKMGSDEVVLGTSVVPSSETGMSRHF